MKNQPASSKKKPGSNNRKRRKGNDNLTKQSPKQNASDIPNDSQSTSNVEKRDSGKTSPVNISEGSEPKIKYVEAPIPKTNPWKKVDNTVNCVIKSETEKIISSDNKSSLNELQAKVDDTNNYNTTENKIVKVVKPILNEANPQQAICKDIKNLPVTSEIEISSTSENALFPEMASSKKNRTDECPVTTTSTAWKTTADTMSKLSPLKLEKVKKNRLYKNGIIE